MDLPSLATLEGEKQADEIRKTIDEVFSKLKESMDADIGRAAYTPREVCQLLGCGRTWLYAQLKSGKIRSIKIAGKRMIPASEITRLLGDE